MPFKPFSNYSVEVDEEFGEVLIEAFDADYPGDTFRGRIPLDELLPVLRRLGRGLARC